MASLSMALLVLLTCCGFFSLCEASVGSNGLQHCSQRKSCGEREYDARQAVCCGGRLHHGPGLSCCGQVSFNAQEATCCEVKVKEHGVEAKVTLGLSQSVSSCCGLAAFNSLNEICCASRVVDKPAANAMCCGKGPYDDDVQLCCDEKILQRISSSHECCGLNQFDTETECCCWIEDAFEIHPKGHQCCSQDSGRPDDVPTVSTARTHACCETGMCPLHQRCGDNLYSLAQRNVLSCSSILHTDREDGEECSDSGVPYNPAKGTTCCSKFHGTPGQHCCSADLYQPHREVCCGGHRHPRKPNWGCCGVKMYEIRNKRMKCCAGTLHTLNSDKSADEARCCGSILQNPRDVCCMSEEKQVLYSARTGFACCGHQYFSKSLWSCCSGVLCPLPVPGNPQREKDEDSRLVSLNILNEQDLCKDIHFGTLESVSLNSLVFRDVMEICGRHATVKPLPLSYILPMPDRCSFPKLTPGKAYFFNETKIFVDFNHESFGESLHFIISKCYHL